MAGGGGVERGEKGQIAVITGAAQGIGRVRNSCSRCLGGAEEICVARENPFVIRLFAKDGKSVAAAASGGGAGFWRCAHSDVIRAIREIAADVNFLNVAGALEIHLAQHSFKAFEKSFAAAHRRMARDEKVNVLGHERRNARDIVSRWGDELTAEKMQKCVWLRPETVAQIEFLEWTEADRLRHSKFVALRDDKNPRAIVKET